MTIAFTSQVEPTQPLEYTQATIEPVFRPHVDKFRFTRGSSTRIVNVVSDGETAAKLLADGFQLSGHPTSKQLPGSVGPETELREGGKWETVRRYDLKMQARSLLAPRLDLSYLARQSGLLDRQASPLDFTLLVSVTTPNLATLFSDVETTFPVLSQLGVAATLPLTAT